MRRANYTGVPPLGCIATVHISRNVHGIPDDRAVWPTVRMLDGTGWRVCKGRLDLSHGFNWTTGTSDHDRPVPITLIDMGAQAEIAARTSTEQWLAELVDV